MSMSGSVAAVQPSRRLSVRRMREDLDAAGINHSACLERGELEKLHAAHIKSGKTAATAQERGDGNSASPRKEKTMRGSPNDATCAICLVDFDDYFEGKRAVQDLPCRHRFHEMCINQLQRSLGKWSDVCPLCMEKLPPNETHRKVDKLVMEAM